MPKDPLGFVLLVEDDDSMRESIRRLLDEAGFACKAFASADSLLDRRAENDPVCVISDLNLPGPSGLELLAALRLRNIGAPFILITGHDRPGLREMVLRSGAAAYLAKPFRGLALLQAIKAAIRPRQARP